MGYPRQVTEKAWRELERRRNASRDQAASRKDEIYIKIPEISRVERQMAASAAGITKAVMASPDKTDEMLEKLRAENLGLQKKREDLLTGAGYPADYLQEKPVCGLCGDKGYIGVKMCSCLEGLLRAEAATFLSSMSPLEKSTFSNFSLSYYPEESSSSSEVIPKRRMGEIYEFCMRYADGFSKSSDNLLMMGQTGLGKTHLSLAIARTVTEKGFGVLYSPAQKLMDRLESEKFSRNIEARGEYMESMSIVLECDLLIIDDLGTEFQSAFSTPVMYNIMNSRLVAGLPTIISTNLEHQEIERKYSPRIVSRLLCEYKVLRFFGTDIRFMRKISGVK